MKGSSGSNATAAESADGPREGEEVVVGYWKEHSTLAHVIIRNAGHMVHSLALINASGLMRHLSEQMGFMMLLLLCRETCARSR